MLITERNPDLGSLDHWEVGGHAGTEHQPHFSQIAQIGSISLREGVKSADGSPTEMRMRLVGIEKVLNPSCLETFQPIRYLYVCQVHMCGLLSYELLTFSGYGLLDVSFGFSCLRAQWCCLCFEVVSENPIQRSFSFAVQYKIYHTT